MHVLIVDDNVGDVELIQLALKKAVPDLQTSTAFDGVDAIAHLRDRAAPDLVLLDLKLPRKGGFEVLAEMKRDRLLRSIPVVVLSSSEHDVDVTRSYQLQASAYFRKPDATYEPLIERIIQFFASARLASNHNGAAALGFRANQSQPPPYESQRSEGDAILAAMPLAVVSVDTSAKITGWNPAAEILFSRTRTEAVTCGVEVLFDETYGKHLREALTNTFKGHPVRDQYLKRLTRKGAAQPMLVDMAPSHDDAGNVTGAVLLCRATSKDRVDARFRLLIEASPNALILVDESGEIVLVNAEAERLFGYSRSELIGASLEALVPERFRDHHPDHRSTFHGSPSARPMGAGLDLFARRKDGSELPVEIGLTPIDGPEGTLVLSAIVDVSDRRQAEERFRLAVESAPSAMVMVDSSGRILLVNAETERLFGYGRSELIGRGIEKLVPERFRENHPAQRTTFMTNPRTRAMGGGRDLYGLRKDGSEFPVEIGLNPIETKDGLVVLSAIVDITARKRAEASLAAKKEELERSNAELEQFAYVASHDLQEPLRMIVAYTKLLDQAYGEALDEKGRKYMGYVRSGATRLQHLIRDLLAYARVNTRGRTPAPVQSGPVVEGALADLALVIRTAEATVDVGPMPSVLADESQLGEVFRNLIANAVKFAPPGSRVIVSSRRMKGDWVFSVSDEGIGIDPAYAERIFGVFERLHGHEEYPGTGMGLAICKRIVERIGGRIWMEPNPDRGSTFLFSLPAA